MTKAFKLIAAQGDILIRRIDALPANLKPATPEKGSYVVAHSETGHHHTVKERAAQLLIDETNTFISYLLVKEETTLDHQRPFDTHESISLAPGNYEIRRQREYVPEGFRRVED